MFTGFPASLVTMLCLLSFKQPVLWWTYYCVQQFNLFITLTVIWCVCVCEKSMHHTPWNHRPLVLGNRFTWALHCSNVKFTTDNMEQVMTNVYTNPNGKVTPTNYLTEWKALKCKTLTRNIFCCSMLVVCYLKHCCEAAPGKVKLRISNVWVMCMGNEVVTSIERCGGKCRLSHPWKVRNDPTLKEGDLMKIIVYPWHSQYWHYDRM